MRGSCAACAAWAILALGGSAQDSPPPRRTALLAKTAPPPGRIRGMLVSEAPDLPLPNATLRLLGESLIGETRLEPGRAAFDLAVEGGAGRFEWAVLAPGHEPVYGVVEVRSGLTADLGAIPILRGSSVIEGRVLDLEGRPAASAPIVLHGELSAAPGRSGEPRNAPRTDAEGRFRIERVRSGRGFLGVAASGELPIPPVPIKIGRHERRWIEFVPEVGTLEVAVETGPSPWEVPIEIALRDEERAMRYAARIEPPEIGRRWGSGSHVIR